MVTVTGSSTEESTTTRRPLVSQNFLARFITALILIPVGLIGMFIGGGVWALMMTALACVGLLEFYALPHGRPIQGYAAIGLPTLLIMLLGFTLNEPLIPVGGLLFALIVTLAFARWRTGSNHTAAWKAISTVGGLLYIGIPIGLLIAITHEERHFVWLVLVMSLTWGTDTFAYFGGRIWGKRKLAPKLSPKKTVEGAVVGVIGGWFPATLFLIAGDAFSVTALIMIGFAPFVAIAGDLLESAIKRFFKVKDSHLTGFNILPGHGGVLDRIDSLLLVSAYCISFIALTGIAS